MTAQLHHREHSGNCVLHHAAAGSGTMVILSFLVTKSIGNASYAANILKNMLKGQPSTLLTILSIHIG